ncbi:MAG TPA: 2-iminoacetate synthase ThiH [Nitrospinota bacterium]|jgi:2-iminoacetate synthase|nr:2-iminoacetate synthase ThiH [Nitrospinota bacterium]MDP7580890.1 2-iminoacetate synthase ThiH [Nitrospinota bacterium]HJN02267.1 2-iminoacetate synthase ThiH [Nitrospinota bacterium]
MNTNNNFFSEFQKVNPDKIKQQIQKVTEYEAEACLHKNRFSPQDIPVLLSPTMEKHLELMARKSYLITRQRFGNVVQLYAPLYLSNECFSICKYCGFSYDNKIDRVTLTVDEVVKEGIILYEQGFRHVLLVSGDASKIISQQYLKIIVKELKKYFHSISIEVHPMASEEYAESVDAGVDGLTVYQETYLPEVYKNMHIKGKKSNFKWRLETPERAGKAGMRRIGIGFLLGLSDWRLDGYYLSLHAQYLMKRFWQSQISISLPRLCHTGKNFQVPHPVKDLQLVQLLCALRMVFPDAILTLSTREKASLRNRLIPLGFTTVSAGSKTEPGGYTRTHQGDSQFEIEDTRSSAEVADKIRHLGLEPVWKDWDKYFLNKS